MDEHAVIVVGGGPTGLMLAAELALAGADVALVERRVSQELAGSRAGGLLPRTLEVLDQRGIAERFVARGQKHHVVMFAGTALGTSDLPSRHNYWLALWQSQFEQLLAGWVAELGVPIHRGCTAAGIAQRGEGVDVALEDGRVFHGAYVVGCDGGRSLVRKHAGIAFPGWDPTVSYLIFEASMAEEPAWGLRHGETGVNALAKLEDGKRVRGVLAEATLEQGDAPGIDALRAALVAAYGTDFGVRDVTWLSRFSDAARQAAAYRERRVLLAGDAAHIHSPAGGQGLNIGVQDAVNLGWKLARVVAGVAPDSLLDTYHAERHPVGARALQATMALTALGRGDARAEALRALMAEAMRMDGPRRWWGAMMSGLDIRYDLGDGHPLLGRRMPDLDLVTADGPRRVYALLHDARPVLLSLVAAEQLDGGRWSDRVRLVDARCDGRWDLPEVGPVEAADAVLIRPDGHVAWVAGESPRRLEDCLADWFGPRAAA